MTQPDSLNSSDVKCQIDRLLDPLEKVCQETPSAKVYAAAKLLRIPPALKDFHRIVKDFQEQLIKQGYFHLEHQETPTITQEQVKKIQQTHDVLKQYELVEEEGEFRLVYPQTNQIAYHLYCYPRFTENSQFWGWQLHFKHCKNPRLDIYLDYNY